MSAASFKDLTTASDDTLERPSLWRATIFPLLALAALIVILAKHADEIGKTLQLLSIKAGLGLVGLHLLALVLRSEAWGLCLDAAGQPVERKLLHASGALRFLADTVVPSYFGAWVRIALIRRYAGKPPNAPTIGQMITADGLCLLIEAMITIILIGIVVFISHIDWWIVVGFISLTAIALGVVILLYKRFRDREFVKTMEVLRSPHQRVVLTALLAVVLTVQPIRFYLAFNALALHPSVADALAAFLLTSVYGTLPIGPGPSVTAAAATLFSGVALGVITASGLVLVGTAVIAASIYSAWGGVILWRHALAPVEESAASGPLPNSA